MALSSLASPYPRWPWLALEALGLNIQGPQVSVTCVVPKPHMSLANPSPPQISDTSVSAQSAPHLPFGQLVNSSPSFKARSNDPSSVSSPVRTLTSAHQPFLKPKGQLRLLDLWTCRLGREEWGARGEGSGLSAETHCERSWRDRPQPGGEGPPRGGGWLECPGRAGPGVLS